MLFKLKHFWGNFYKNDILEDYMKNEWFWEQILEKYLLKI